jgi:hypothetical protein
MVGEALIGVVMYVSWCPALMEDVLTLISQGYYFTATQEVTQLETAKRVGQILHAQGRLSAPDPKQLDLATIDGLMQHRVIANIARYLFAANSRSSADRARKLFDFHPSQPGLWDELEADLAAAQKA